MKLAKLFFALPVVLSVVILSSCCISEKTTLGVPTRHRSGTVEHVVLIWLKHKGNAQERAQIIATAKSFAGKIPGILALHVGEPLPSTRPVVDSSFDVGLVIRFESKAAMDAYEKNPVHEQAVKDILKPLAAKLVVHDWTVQ